MAQADIERIEIFSVLRFDMTYTPLKMKKPEAKHSGLYAHKRTNTLNQARKTPNSIFSHPDCNCRFRNCTGIKNKSLFLADYTADWEFHPTPKINI
jgi:hypothetical protein